MSDSAAETRTLSQKVQELVSLYKKYGLYSESGIVPNAEQWKTLLELPEGKKIYLVSMFIFTADPSSYMGEASLRTYQQIDEELGSKHFFSGTVRGTFTGQAESTEWKSFNIKEFPNLEALVAFMTDPRLLELQKKRPGIVGKQRTIIVTADG